MSLCGSDARHKARQAKPSLSHQSPMQLHQALSSLVDHFPSQQSMSQSGKYYLRSRQAEPNVLVSLFERVSVSFRVWIDGCIIRLLYFDNGCSGEFLFCFGIWTLITSDSRTSKFRLATISKF